MVMMGPRPLATQLGLIFCTALADLMANQSLYEASETNCIQPYV